MPELQNWDNVVVPQRHITGCIPTGFEWLIRYLRIQAVNPQTFQEDFDLGNNNSFNSVAGRIRERYSNIDVQSKSFDQGIEKIRKIQSLIEEQKPCLISLALGHDSGWHIMLIVRVSNGRIDMIHSANTGGNHTWGFSVEEIKWRHDNLSGGKDISWIEPARPQKSPNL
jgi:hypothetical protein